MKISVVVPAHNEEKNMPVLLTQIRDALPNALHEIIVVDDGSEDGTLEAVVNASKGDARIKYISLSRNFGHQAALRAGLRGASGDCVISMDADLQHPPRILPEMVEKWKEGFAVVLTIRKDIEETSRFKRLTSSAFYWIMNSVSDVSIEPGSADFRLLDRKVVEVINGLSEHDFFLRGIIPWVGFQVFKISYAPDQRLYGSTKYSLRKMISFALSGVIANSIHPLRLATIFAVFIAGMTALYALYALVIFLTDGRVVPGWTSVAMVVSIVGSLQLLVLGVLGEYVGKILRETRKRPGFVISRSNLDEE
jgi:polyisoprenyl-phosphate glycosyltransferase